MSKLYENASCQLVTKNAIDGILETLLLRLAGRLIEEYYFLINNQFILHCTRFIVKIYIVDIIIYNVKVLGSLIVLIS